MTRILLSRTDTILDVILTLPMAGLIKKYNPEAQVIFLGTQYTKPVLDCSIHIDEFYDWNEIKTDPCQKIKELKCDIIIHIFPKKEIAKAAKNAEIETRIGTNRRFYHWFYCNKKVNLSRKNSNLHEAQLNIKLLEPLNINTNIDVNEIPALYGMTRIKALPVDIEKPSARPKFNLILHPKSKGSAQEWDAQNFVNLAQSLPKEKFNIFVTGTKEESSFINKNIISKCDNVTNLCGVYSLSEFITFINTCDGLIAASTGPLHIAAALGKHALGLYPPLQSMNPARWGPLGEKAQYLTGETSINDISPLTVQKLIEKWT